MDITDIEYTYGVHLFHLLYYLVNLTVFTLHMVEEVCMDIKVIEYTLKVYILFISYILK